MARDAAHGGHRGIEILLVQRAAQLRFMGGMHVFPGGAVHASDAAAAISSLLTRGAIDWPDDRASASDLPPGAVEGPASIAAHPAQTAAESVAAGSNTAEPPEGAVDVAPPGSRESAAGSGASDWRDAAVRDRAFAVAAIRETCEEVGLLLGVAAAHSRAEHVRARLAQDVALATALEEIGASLDLSVLVPLSRWITPVDNPVRFDTRFYVARAPSTEDASADGTETCSIVWRTPAQAIDAHRDGTLVLSPPTRCTLEDIAELSSVNQLIEYATGRPAPRIEPVSAQIDGRKVILFPGDPEHPVRERALRGPTRRPL